MQVAGDMKLTYIHRMIKASAESLNQDGWSEAGRQGPQVGHNVRNWGLTEYGCQGRAVLY